MSIALMTLVWKSDFSSGQKMVLLALCDNANDQGECYPSISMLAKKCSMSERSVFNHIADLEKIGAVKRENRTGRSTIYTIDPCKFCTPANSAPLQPLHPTPAKSAPTPLQILHPTPATVAPITINEPSIEPSGNQKKIAPLCVAVSVLLENGFDDLTAKEFIDHKARMKAPLTARAWADHLAESAKAGWTPLAAAEKVMAKNWKGFEAKYVANEAKPNQAYESPYAKSMREKYESITPLIAAKNPNLPKIDPNKFIYGEVTNEPKRIAN